MYFTNSLRDFVQIRYCALLYCRDVNFARFISYTLGFAKWPFLSKPHVLSTLQRTQLGILCPTFWSTLLSDLSTGSKSEICQMFHPVLVKHPLTETNWPTYLKLIQWQIVLYHRFC
jgi:hypothetical protein